ncbi:hypothetical protein I4U23_003554 [Adineta vaga]|nr:hypothetical protein I4U23_003554 [Adineta vaga]
MFKHKEETIPLTYNVSTTNENYQIAKYFNFETRIKTIDQRNTFHDDVSSHFVVYTGLNKQISIYLTKNAFKLFKDNFHKLIPYHQSQIDEIRQLLEKDYNLFYLHENGSIEWCLSGSDMIKKRKQFREQIDLYKTYDNKNHLITKLLIEITDYYLKDYLIRSEHFTKEQTEKLAKTFQKQLTNKIILNSFYRVLNEHIALYIFDYFDVNSYYASPKKYRLINCLVHIVTLLINHPDIYEHQYLGTVYRGLSMKTNDFKHYTIGNHILNRTFLSTSKKEDVARFFAKENFGQINIDDYHQSKVSVLSKYSIKQNKTAINTAEMSKIPDEEEVLILPFAVFEVKNKIKCTASVQYEIELKECIDDDDE